MTDLSFGQLLRERRKALGIETQADLQRLLARRNVKVSVNSISYWETGERAPRRAKLDVLLDVLAVPTEDHRGWYAAAFAVGESAQEDDDALPPEKADGAAA